MRCPISRHSVRNKWVKHIIHTRALPYQLVSHSRPAFFSFFVDFETPAYPVLAYLCRRLLLMAPRSAVSLYHSRLHSCLAGRIYSIRRITKDFFPQPSLLSCFTQFDNVFWPFYRGVCMSGCSGPLNRRRGVPMARFPPCMPGIEGKA